VKRWLWPLLLVSLGLNIGLGFRLATAPEGGTRVPDRSGRHVRHPDGLSGAMADSAAWSERVERRLARLLDRLDLDEDARREFASAHRRNAARVWSLGRELHLARLELRAVAREPGDPRRVRAAVRRLTTAQTAFDSVIAETLLSELDALPADRQARYLELLPWQRWGPSGKGDGPRHEMRHGGAGRSSDRRREPPPGE
jgi:hypothetical protein